MTKSESADKQIFVKSHVPRDLLQNAAIFKNSRLVVWEYVANGLDYIDESTNPLVIVKLDNRKKRITIADNGRGMDIDGLKNFFVMHGENIDRKKGRPGRGRFGTGKSAAFGIADTLRITTVRNGKLSKVYLTRKDIKEMGSEDPIPVHVENLEEPINQPNGTMVEIEDIHIKSLDQPGVIQFIERHLVHWHNANVIVNNHICELKMPVAVDTRTFRSKPPISEKIGDVTLTINIAGEPLDKDLCGVAIFANGVLHETTLAGHEGRPMTQYMYGEIDVPKLDEDTGPIPPFDLTRSMQLNPSNELVQATYAFIGLEIDQIRRELEKNEKQRKATEEAKKLAQQADSIARVINEDFHDFQQRVARAKAMGGTGFDPGPQKNKAGSDPTRLAFGSQEPAKIISPTGDPGSEGGTSSGGKEPRTIQPQVTPAPPEAEKLGRLAGGSGSRTISRGGFKVEFKPMGTDTNRALYSSSERAIYINIDHPQLVAAKGTNPIENPIFQRLAYEVAFSEYAIALSAELNENDEYSDTSDPIVDIRETINRIARKAAPLYSIN